MFSFCSLLHPLAYMCVIIERRRTKEYTHMAQLLAGGIIALGLLILAFGIFIASRENKRAVSSSTNAKPEPHTTAPTPTVVPQPEAKEVGAAENVLPISTPVKPMLLVYEGEQSSLWWQEQFHSLTAQLQYLREHAKDVERQIAILSEIAALATELEMLQKKRELSPEGRISLFPLQVHRQPTDMSYVTDKRPAVRKYTIEALS